MVLLTVTTRLKS